MIRTGGAVLCAGNIVQDVLVRAVDRLVFDQTIWVDDIETALGGNAANTSYTLARLGTRVRLASITGRDEWGDRALQMLTSAGVDTTGVVRSELPTSRTVVLVRGDGARAFFHKPGCAGAEFPIEFGPGLGHFHFANIFALPRLRSRAADVMARAKAAGLTTSVDTGWDTRGEWKVVIDPVLPYTDLLFVNRDEGRMLSGCDDVDGAARYFLDRGVRIVATKLGGDGCAVHGSEGKISVPAFGVDVVDSTGAGDCFAGGFLAAFEHGMNMHEAASFANAVGALSVQQVGAVRGVRGFRETQAWMRSRG